MEQALASRGTGAPTQPTAAVADASRADSPDSGFDWGSAAIGAAVAACLFAAGTLTAMTLGRRGRLRTRELKTPRRYWRPRHPAGPLS